MIAFPCPERHGGDFIAHGQVRADVGRESHLRGLALRVLFDVVVSMAMNVALLSKPS